MIPTLSQPSRTMNKAIIKELMSDGIKLGASIKIKGTPDNISIGNLPSYVSWRTRVLSYVSTSLDKGQPYAKSLNNTLLSYGTVLNLLQAIEILRSLLSDIERGLFDISEPKSDALASLSVIFNRFDKVAKQLRKRHDNRPSLDINDEYDVQDLLYALLRLYFDDIEPEDCIPKFASKGSRCDFVLRDHNIIIEAKKTRSNLKDKEIGEELTLDIAKYSKYPNVKHLICFVYDPEGYIRNVKGLETDLVGLKNGIDVHIFIRPV